MKLRTAKAPDLGTVNVQRLKRKMMVLGQVLMKSPSDCHPLYDI